jgi:hypothetical protein
MNKDNQLKIGSKPQNAAPYQARPSLSNSCQELVESSLQSRSQKMLLRETLKTSRTHTNLNKLNVQP